jgi:hypothetical protein
MIIVLIFLASIIAILLFLLLRQKSKDQTEKLSPASTKQTTSTTKLPYVKQPILLSKNERAFYEVLNHIVMERAKIFIKMRMGDLLYIDKQTPNRLLHWNKIKAKHIDFVLCDHDMKPIAVVELDDSLPTPERVEQDEFITQVFEDANLPLFRFQAKDSYVPAEVSQHIEPIVAYSTTPILEDSEVNMGQSS